MSRTVFFCALFVSLLMSLEIGSRIGRLRRRRLDGATDEGANLVVGSILGLLAFVLALNLSNASSRYDRRMSATLDEVNAVGTALMQATAVGGGNAEAMVAELRKYLQVRRAYIEIARDPAALERVYNDTSALQNVIWALLSERISAEPTPAVTSLMNAINNAFDASTAMRLAMEYRMPEQLILLLRVMSLLGVAAVGYQFGLGERKGRIPGIVLSALWCIVVTEIIDIGSARMWTLRTDTRVYDWTIETFEGLPEASG
ncbi:MAG: hypothetical protein ACK5JR_00950 [Tropicimonas sp.]|uniref:hypothetical protein n=1 Tax=Tropicimonas sp. TaxID=2067044 RepID=UPI003A855D01